MERKNVFLLKNFQSLCSHYTNARLAQIFHEIFGYPNSDYVRRCLEITQFTLPKLWIVILLENSLLMRLRGLLLSKLRKKTKFKY